MDPGNFATNISAGAKYGYMLLWVIVVAPDGYADPVPFGQLGIATGLNLAEQCRANFPRPVVWVMWFLMELLSPIATDLAEFLGAALGFQTSSSACPSGWQVSGRHLTFLVALAWSATASVLWTAVITALIGVIGLCY